MCVCLLPGACGLAQDKCKVRVSWLVVQSQYLEFSVINNKWCYWAEFEEVKYLVQERRGNVWNAIAFTPVEGSGMSRGTGMAGQVNGLEMLIAKEGFRALPKGTGAWTDIWCVNNASRVGDTGAGGWKNEVAGGDYSSWLGLKKNGR